MKKYIIILVFIFLMYQNVFCQETNKRFTIQASPNLLLIDLMYLRIQDSLYFELFIMDLEFQYKINNALNISLAMSVYSYPENFWESRKDFYMNFSPVIIYRPLKTGLRGFYIGLYPIIGWQSVEGLTYVNTGGQWNKYLFAELGFGLNTGYKWIFGNGFSLQLGIGISKKFSIPERPNFYDEYQIRSDGSHPINGFDMKIIDLKIGYSF